MTPVDSVIATPQASTKPVRFEVFTVVTMKNTAFCDIETQLHLTGDTLRLRYRV
jgi:hypothetical protein